MDGAPGSAPATAATESSSRQVTPIVGALPALLVGGVMAWWAWKRGAYFPVAFYPGAIVLFASLGLLLAFAPWPGRLRGPARTALWSMVALGGWTLISALWSPAEDIALEDALRVFTYAAAFALGLWICLLLRRRTLLAIAPIAAAGALVAVVTLVALAFGDNASLLLEEDATLRYPLGYRNAAAAFFVTAMLALTPLAAGAELDWRLRGGAAAAATLCLQLAVLAQSRGAVFATAAGVACMIAVHPTRWRVTMWLGLSVVGAAITVPALLAVYSDSGGVAGEALSELRTACAAMAVSAAAVFAAGAALARGSFAPELSPGVQRAARMGAIALVGVALLAAAVAVFSAEGGPLGALNRQTDELSAGTPDLTKEGTRYGFDFGSERGDFWRVALDDLDARPLSGRGAGGFRYSYLLARDSPQQPEDPHSVLMLMASELGLPGLLCLVLFLITALLALMRSRRLGGAAAALAASAAGIGAYWLVHADLDWFWAYPSITLPMAYALGAAAAPALIDAAPTQGRPSRVRIAGAVGAGLVALAMVPLWLSEKYTDAALERGQTDLDRAYRELSRAEDLNPLSDRPLAAEAVIAEGAGEPQRALAALARAEERRPEEWTLYYLEARVLADLDRDAALRALQMARELNPSGAEIDALQQRIRGESAP